MIKLSGLSVKNDKNPDGDIAIQFNGLRPGEKLYEELLIGENVSGTKHQRIMRANEEFMTWSTLEQKLDKLEKIMQVDNILEIKSQLTNIVDGYKPWLEKPIMSDNKNVIPITKSY
jgi:FlaA1/EpsC-like NDP-sugar epimerase